ncbi:condensation domain-containing protein [Streptomyces bottropensis]|uniref:condensation domain-containing protein n=1 Tax=Streptomyces bottropensis TaxID=42235 RepID=UPI003690B396
MQTQVSSSARTLVDILRDRAFQTPRRTALTFLEDSGTEYDVDYAELDRRARAVAAALTERGMRGERALLLFPPGPDYVAGFLGCLYAGAVAVPQYLPSGRRGAAGVLGVAADSGAALVLSNTAARDGLWAQHPEFAESRVPWLLTDGPVDTHPHEAIARGPRPEDLAFLQYTSGSTGTPKGVMVRHENLVHNSAAISRALGTSSESRGVSWLPPYHDMGLIGGILQPLYAGFPCTLMSPMAFLRQPLRWLAAVSRHRATVSAAPDFAYLECVRRIGEEDRRTLDLSSWEQAMTGAEPVRAETLELFSRTFAPNGFRSSSFHPCYGMAETTLFVTGGSSRPEHEPVVLELDRRALELGLATEATAVAPVDGTQAADGTEGPGTTRTPTAGLDSVVRLTACGTPQSEDLVVVVDTEGGEPCAPGRVGEIWVSGPTVTSGYWGRPEQSRRDFGARLATYPEREFLRTGDLGFLLDGRLFVTGRLKDVMIVRGRNHYPQDFERTAELAHPMIQPTRSAAFSVDRNGTEQVVIVHEVARGFRSEQAQEVIEAVARAVASEHGPAPYEVVLVRRGVVPRTTSGKVRRGTCRDLWLAGELPSLARGGPGGPIDGADHRDEKPGDLPVAAVVAAALDRPAGELPADVPLVALGLDSLGAVRLAEGLRREFGDSVPHTDLLDDMTLRRLGEWAAGRPRPVEPGEAEASSGPGDEGLPGPAEPAPATRGQEWIWLLDSMGAGSAYHVVGGVHLRGPLRPDALQNSLNALVDRHEVLRTTFAPIAEGSLQATVGAAGPVPLPLVDVREHADPAERARLARQAVEELGRAPFDLRHGPLLRAVLVQEGPDTWCLGVAAHHIAVDGWSLGMLLSELGDLYREGADTAGSGSRRPRSPAPLRETTEGEAYWRATLDGASAVTLPVDRPVPRKQSWNGAALPVSLSTEQVARVKGQGARHGATPYMVLLAAFSCVLHRWTGQGDLVIGTPAAGRLRPGASGEVGMFVNTLPLRIAVAGASDFPELIGRVREACLASYPYQDVPLERIVELTTGADRAGARAPLVRVCLALQNIPLEGWEADGVSAEPFELPAPGAQFELSLHLSAGRDGGMTGHVTYATDLFEEGTVRALLDAFQALLDAALESPGTPPSRLPLLTSAAAERHHAEAEGSGFLVVDEAGRPVPHGVSGELWEAATDTSAGFAPSGRLARRTSEGRPEDLGRLDRVTEIAGCRVSPDQVAALLRSCSGIAEATVEVRSGAQGPLLAVRLGAAGPVAPKVAELRAFLAERLPAAAVPSTWEWSEPHEEQPSTGTSFPPAFADGPDENPEHVEPRDETERTLADIWCDVLGLSEVSVRDDFFDLGGQSLQAARVVVRVEAAFGTAVSVDDLLRTGLTIERLAERLLEAGATAFGAQDDPDVASTLAALEELSDDEIADLLERP